jgi:hypothetical protein
MRGGGRFGSDYQQRLAAKVTERKRAKNKTKREEAFSSPPPMPKSVKPTKSILERALPFAFGGMGEQQAQAQNRYRLALMGANTPKERWRVSREFNPTAKALEEGYGGQGVAGTAAKVARASSEVKAGNLQDLLKQPLEDITKLTDNVVETLDDIGVERVVKSPDIIIPNAQEVGRILRALNYPEGTVTDDLFEVGLQSILDRLTRQGLRVSDTAGGRVNKDPIEGLSSRILDTMGRSAAARLKGESPLFDFLNSQDLIRFSKTIDPQRWDQLTSIMSKFTRGEGLMPSSISARVYSKQGTSARPLQWQPDHAPFGVSWLDEALNAAIPMPQKLGRKAQKEIAEGYNWLFNESGVLVPKPANIGLGSLPRIGKESLGWKNLENTFPNQAKALEDLGLLKVYDDLATRMQGASKTAFNIAEEYDSAKAIQEFLNKIKGFQGRSMGV